MRAEVVGVAGCLFEVHLDEPADWIDGGSGTVTLIASAGSRRFRFRAERAGSATIRFQAAGGQALVQLTVAPEDWAV